MKFVDDIRSAGLFVLLSSVFCEGARCDWEEQGKRNKIKKPARNYTVFLNFENRSRAFFIIIMDQCSLWHNDVVTLTWDIVIYFYYQNHYVVVSLLPSVPGGQPSSS